MRVYDIYRFYTGSKRTIAELFSCIRQFLTDQQLSFDELSLLVAPSHWGAACGQIRVPVPACPARCSDHHRRKSFRHDQHRCAAAARHSD